MAEVTREFEAVDLSDEALPEAICHACAKDAMVHVPTGTVAVYCGHNEAGAWRVHGEWTSSIVRPIDIELFVRRTRIMLDLAEQHPVGR